MRNATFRITLDDFPDPATAHFGPVILRSGRVNFDIDVRVDLVGRAILATPRTLLLAQNRYDVGVNQNVFSIDGRRIDKVGVVASFAVGEALISPPQPQRRRYAVDVQPILAGCAPYCHSRASADGTPRAPTRQLDLTGDPEDPVFGLIRVPSVGLAGLPRALERVTPGDAASSVLLRKLLGGNAHQVSTDPPYPPIGVDGRRMPLSLDDTAPPPPPLDDATIRVIADWIDQGAPLD